MTATVRDSAVCGATWDAGRRLLETRLTGAVDHADVRAWQDGLARELARVPDGASFKLLNDLRGFDPVTIDVHKAMREVVPRLLAAHGMRPAFVDLFDSPPEVTVTTTRGITCTAFANVHHDEDKMQSYERRIGRPDQRFFTDRAAAEAWLDAQP